MKLKLESSRLAKACSLAAKNVPNKTNLPIIKTLHVVADNDVLHISSTDMETWVVYDVPADVYLDDTPSAFCVDAANLTNLLQALPAQPIEIELLEREYSTPKAYYIKIKHSCGLTELPTELADEFPTLMPIKTEGHSVPAEVLKKSIQTCRFAMFGDAEMKPQMASLCLHFKGSSMVSVATDSNMIARLEHPEVEGALCQYLLPRKTLGLLLPILDDVLRDKEAMDVVMIRKDNNNVCIQTDAAVLYFRQPELKYPNYDAVIPKKGQAQFEAVINRSDLMAAVSRASLFTDAASMRVACHFNVDGMLLVRGHCVDFGTSSEEQIKCEFTGSKNFSIGFKATFLKDVLSHLSSELVRISMIDATRQVVFTEENGNPNVLMLLMPMFL